MLYEGRDLNFRVRLFSLIITLIVFLQENTFLITEMFFAITDSLDKFSEQVFSSREQKYNSLHNDFVHQFMS